MEPSTPQAVPNSPDLLRKGIEQLKRLQDPFKELWDHLVTRLFGEGNLTNTPIWRIVGVFVLLLVGLYIVRRVSETVIVIEPIVIPKSLDAEGYSGTIIANMLRDEIRNIAEGSTVFTSYAYIDRVPPRQKITDGSTTDLPRTPGFFLAPNALKGSAAIEAVVVPTTGLTLGSVIEAIQYMLNRSPIRITGDIVPNGDYSTGNVTTSPYLLNIRFEHRVDTRSISYSSSYSLPSTDETLHAAAEQIYQVIDPFALALYKLNVRRPEGEIRSVLEHAIKEDPKHTYWTLFILGDLAARRGEHNTAVWWFDRSIQENTDAGEGWFSWYAAPKDEVLLSVTYLHKIQSLMHSAGNTNCEDAKKTLEQYDAVGKSSIGMKLSTEAWVVHLCDKKAVNDLIDQAIESDPTHAAKYYGSLGAILYQTGSYTGSLAAVNQAITHDPTDPITHYLRGANLFNQQKYREAKTSFATAIDLSSLEDGVYWYAMYNLAWTHNHLKETEERDILFCQMLEDDAAGLRPPDEYVFVSRIILSLVDAPCEGNQQAVK